MRRVIAYVAAVKLLVAILEDMASGYGDLRSPTEARRGMTAMSPQEWDGSPTPHGPELRDNIQWQEPEDTRLAG
jgi:hypothetical protein